MVAAESLDDAGARLGHDPDRPGQGEQDEQQDQDRDDRGDVHRPGGRAER